MTELSKLGKNVLILDGAMGTLLKSEGFSGRLEELNITAADEIKRIHRAYSSADIILTHSFGLNSANYKGRYSLAELALKAIENARAVSETVFFDVGPIWRRDGFKELSFKETYSVFKEIADLTRDSVDGYFAETFTDLSEIGACIRALKETSKPVFATMAFTCGGNLCGGVPPEEAAAALGSFGADAAGVNCIGAEETLRIIERMAKSVSLPLIAKPSAGLPVKIKGRDFYGTGAEKFEEYAKKFIAAGASVIGGCCGTTPDYIGRIAKLSGVPAVRRSGT